MIPELVGHHGVVVDLQRLGDVGGDGIDADAVWRDLQGQAPREVDDGRLVGAVGGIGGIAAQPFH